MKLNPILIHGLDGRPLTPVIKADLAPLAKDATVQALGKEATLLLVARETTLLNLVTAVQALPRLSTKVHRVTLSLAAALNNAVVGLGTLTKVQSVNVVDLTGSVVPTMKFNGTTEAAIPLAKGEIRNGLDVTTLHVTCGAGGGSLVLELMGR